ncbi:hypothetical protein, partial [Mesorhizobium sp.]|uniref:hypothetical protein n=1 Tax=Mesorhizobium sp. TaxID=1871066 RepID=UPI003454227E
MPSALPGVPAGLFRVRVDDAYCRDDSAGSRLWPDGRHLCPGRRGELDFRRLVPDARRHRSRCPEFRGRQEIYAERPAHHLARQGRAGGAFHLAQRQHLAGADRRRQRARRLDRQVPVLA